MGRAQWTGGTAALMAATQLAGCSGNTDTVYTGYGSNLPNGAYLYQARVTLTSPTPSPGRELVSKRAAELAALQDASWAQGVLGAVLATATSGIPHTVSNGPDPLVWVVSMEPKQSHTYLFEYIDAYSGRSIGASGGPLPGFSPSGPTLPAPAAQPPSTRETAPQAPSPPAPTP